ncbi:unnamed protein product [Litomosoides sigmodontis]|uniref:Uncharacterized protein n=1 Tax=Litomosoides sigmodontis TaxID=42156 RepID=A0A3P6S214_LITSI|nr:unnamed protein product [Litomosoides sigmodontis]
MPRRGFDSIRRMPIVVIPRKRKYKNYASKRRNTQFIASLRRCFSDPMSYRSYNHWDGLSRPFSPEKPSSSLSSSTNAAPIAAIPEATSFDDSTIKIEARTRKEFASSVLKKSKFEERGAIFGNELIDQGDKEGDGRKIRDNLKSSNIFDFEIKKAGIAANYSGNVIPYINHEGESLVNVALRAPTPPTTSRVRPRNLASRGAMLSRTSAVETPLIKRRLLDCERYPEGIANNRKDYHREYVNLPSGSNNLDEREEERTAEQKAQNTVTAVTAAFSTLTLEPQQTEYERAIAEQASNTGAITVVGGREAARTAGQVSIRLVSETEKPVMPVPQQPNVNLPNDNNNAFSISGDSGPQKSRKAVPQSTVITLIPPPSTRKLKPIKFSHNSLLATLQLPPSISAKVDRIVANAGRKEKEGCSTHAAVSSVSFSVDTEILSLRVVNPFR